MRVQSKRGWFFLQVNGDIFLFMLALGRLTISIDHARKVKD